MIFLLFGTFLFLIDENGKKIFIQIEIKINHFKKFHAKSLTHTFHICICKVVPSLGTFEHFIQLPASKIRNRFETNDFDESMHAILLLYVCTYVPYEHNEYTKTKQAAFV